MNEKSKRRRVQIESEDESDDSFDNVSQVPIALVEKRKKVSQQFDDLSRLNDLESTQVSCGFEIILLQFISNILS